jgi:two-component system cell cycle sensor histidine kinase/response regulator CckA
MSERRRIGLLIGIMAVACSVVAVVSIVMLRNTATGIAGTRPTVVGAGFVTGGVTAALVLLGALLFARVGNALNAEGECARAEDALRRSEENYRAIFDAANDAIFVHDMKTGAILDVNRKMCEMYGCTRDEACILTVEDLSTGIPPHTQEHALHWIKAAVDGRPQIFEWHAKRSDGEPFWVEVNLKRATIMGEDRLLAVVRDITDRKRAERDLSESRFELAIQNRISEIFLTAAPDEVYGAVLEAVLEATESENGVFGYIGEEGRLVCPSMKGDVWDRCRVEGKDTVFERDAWSGVWGRTLLERQAVCSNEPSQVPEGHIPISRSLAAPIVHGGEVIGLLHVANRKTDYMDKDIERLKGLCSHIAPILRATLERTRADHARRTSDELYRQLADSVDFGISRQDTEHRIMMTNSAMAAMFNKPVSELVGRFCYKEYEKRDTVCTHCPARQAMATGEPAEVETEGVLDDGSRFTARLRAFPLHDAEGRLTGFVESVNNVTAQRRAEERLHEHVEKLERANQRIKQQQDDIVRASKLASIGTLAAGVAHEINNPLVAIAGYSEMLLDRLERVTDEQLPKLEYFRERLRTINEEAFRCKQITQGLLGFARTSVHDGRGAFDLRDAVQHALDLMAAHPRHSPETSACVDLGDREIRVACDRDGLVQVFLNLGTNAFDAMEPGGLLRITAQVTDDVVEVVFRDEGRGMDQATLAQVFDPFFTTKEVGEGTGLGLAVARSIVEANGGHIHTESDPGRGTTMTVRLPLAPGEEADEAA